jgi:hypothetical protein
MVMAIFDLHNVPLETFLDIHSWLIKYEKELEWKFIDYRDEVVEIANEDYAIIFKLTFGL